MSDYLLKGGRVVDPVRDFDEVADVHICNGHIAAVGSDLETGDADVLNCSGLVVAPGLVDLHTHVREPGREDEETIASASAAAAAGGYCAICAMPNTNPIADSAVVVEKVWALGREAGLVEVVPAGALTRGQNGEEMADLGDMARSRARVRLFTDDGRGLQSSLMARRTMEYLIAFDGIYAEHCEDEALAAGGHMNEGERSVALGLNGQPAEAEELMAARDIVLCRLTGCRLHLLHVSTKGTVELVRVAKSESLPVTAEATPHHFTLTEEAIDAYEPNAKVNPPLRAPEDRDAVIAGLSDGTIDAIATDHAPHSREEKEAEFVLAPPGLVGLETSLALTVSGLVNPGHLSLSDAIRRLSVAPAQILGLSEHGGPLVAGAAANVAVFDPQERWVVDTGSFESRSVNTPFAGSEVTGRSVFTFFEGRLTATRGRATDRVVA
jgi:dihydroorotase